MDNSASSLALIAILGTVITALFKLLADNTKAQGKLTEAMERVATETAKGSKEAKQRNGHLGELVHQGNEITHQILQEQKKTAKMLANNPTDQHIEHQTVDHQTIKEK